MYSGITSGRVLHRELESLCLNKKGARWGAGIFVFK